MPLRRPHVRPRLAELRHHRDVARRRRRQHRRAAITPWRGSIHVGGVFSVLSYFLYVSYVCPEPVLVNRRVACRVRMKPKHKQQPSDSFIGRALLSHTWRGSRPHRAQATSARRPTDRAKRSFFGVFRMFVLSLSW